jgi:hypothetical protein
MKKGLTRDPEIYLGTKLEGTWKCPTESTLINAGCCPQCCTMPGEEQRTDVAMVLRRSVAYLLFVRVGRHDRVGAGTSLLLSISH